MISNLKYDIEFRREKALELSIGSNSTWPRAGGSPDLSPLKSIHHLLSVPQRLIQTPSSNAAPRR